MPSNISDLSWHLQKLPHFHMTAKYGSIRLAAKHLKISQPSLSKSIQSLENACGVQLFTRGRQGVTLTASGQLLYQFSESLHQNTAILVRNMLAASNVTVPIRFATHELFVPGIFPDLIHALKLYDPALVCTLGTEPSSSNMIRMIINGDIDIAFVVEGAPNKKLYRQELMEDSFGFYASNKFLKANNITRHSNLSVHEVCERFPVIYAPNVTASTTENLGQCLARLSIEIRSNFNVSSLESVSALVNANLGIGILPVRFGQHLRNSDVSRLDLTIERKPAQIGKLTMYMYYGAALKDQTTLLKKIRKIVQSQLI